MVGMLRRISQRHNALIYSIEGAVRSDLENKNERSARIIGSNFRRRSGRSLFLRRAAPNIEAEGKKEVSR